MASGVGGDGTEFDCVSLFGLIILRGVEELAVEFVRLVIDTVCMRTGVFRGFGIDLLWSTTAERRGLLTGVSSIVDNFCYLRSPRFKTKCR